MKKLLLSCILSLFLSVTAWATPFLACDFQLVTEVDYYIIKLNNVDEQSSPLDIGGGNVRLNWDLNDLEVGEHTVKVMYVKPDQTPSVWSQEHTITVQYLWFGQPYAVSKKIIQFKLGTFSPPLDSVKGLILLIE